ncbi:MAG TPA: serine acetyltransferase [Candidatus Omnitrophica bacterium]|nr:serine acetyltransferase [Candidatus Omnitrophota bacterium]HCI45028.1 serine acetyltransferase [Candidatus Omnitrophota bacterium]
MLDNLKADIKRYVKDPRTKENIYLIFEQGIWAVAVYRFGRWVRGVRVPVISSLFKIVAFLLFKLTEIIAGISLPASADIGKGFYVGHFGGIILHSDVKMGENCSIGPGVLIGTRGLGNTGVPVIGNNVYIGSGAKILGGIKIGDNVKIGANAVVLSDVPDGATAAGVPAKIIKS